MSNNDDVRKLDDEYDAALDRLDQAKDRHTDAKKRGDPACKTYQFDEEKAQENVHDLDDQKGVKLA